MNDLIVTWLTDNRQYAILAVPTLAFLEATVGVGMFVSGVILLTTSTILYTEGIATLAQILPLAFAAAFISDHCGYYIGRWFGPKIHASGFAQRNAKVFDKTETYIRRFGPGAVVFGRLMTAIRSIVPLVIGISGLPPARFMLFDLLACPVWTAGLGLLVVGLGNAFG